MKYKYRLVDCYAGCLGCRSTITDCTETYRCQMAQTRLGEPAGLTYHMPYLANVAYFGTLLYLASTGAKSLYEDCLFLKSNCLRNVLLTYLVNK